MSKTKKNVKKLGTPKEVKTVPSSKKMEQKNELTNSLYLDEFTKVRRMSLQLYCSPERWDGVLFSAKHYAYIYHDKDVDKDGKPVTAHYHLLLVFENPRYREGVRKLFELEGLTQDTTINFQKLVNSKGAFQYLRHNTPEAQSDKKHLYNIDEIVCDDLAYWEDVTDVDTHKNEDFLNDLCSDLSYRDLALRYGRDYIKNFRAYDDFGKLVQREELKQFNQSYSELAIKRISQCSDDLLTDELKHDIGLVYARQIRHLKRDKMQRFRPILNQLMDELYDVIMYEYLELDKTEYEYESDTEALREEVDY